MFLDFPPESWLNPKLENRTDQATDIVTKNLTKSLINLRGFSLTSQRITKFCLDHAERRFDVAALMVALHKPFRVEAER
jgi:hypothetical protein